MIDFVQLLAVVLAALFFTTISLLLIPIGPNHQDQPEQRDETLREQQVKQRKEDWTFGVLNASFWLLLLVFVLIVALGYLR